MINQFIIIMSFSHNNPKKTAGCANFKVRRLRSGLSTQPSTVHDRWEGVHRRYMTYYKSTQKYNSSSEKVNKFSDFSLCCLLFCVFALICFDLLLLVLPLCHVVLLESTAYLVVRRYWAPLAVNICTYIYTRWRVSEVILHDYYVLYQIVLDCICLYSVYRYAAAGSSRVEDKFVVVPIEATTFAMSQCGKKREEEREEATKGGRQ